MGWDRSCGRTLHLIDIENLVGNPFATAAAIRQGLDDYTRAADVGPDDLAVVAMNRFLFKQAAYVVEPGWAIRPALGPDGADLALLADAPAFWTASRFDRLVVGSGDGIFSDLVAEVSSAGTEAWVVSHAGCLSRRLARAADHVVLLDRPLPGGPTSGIPLAA